MTATAPRPVAWLADRLRRAGQERLFGPALASARFVHWTTQWYAPPEVARIQWEALVDLVTYARAASPFYRQRLGGAGMTEPLTPETFRQIRPLTRDEVVSAARAIRTGKGFAGLVRRRSGGSGGREIGIPLDRTTYCWYIAGTWRGLRWWGADFTDRGAILLGPRAGGLRGVAVGAKDWAMNWLRLPVDGRFDRQAPQLLERLEAFGPAFLYGYPSAVHRLANLARARGWRPRHRLRVAVLTGEPLYAYQRRSVAEIFQCPVAEEYGNGELGSMAFECPDGHLHVTAENVYLETLGPDPSANGSGGLILATQLRNRRFPLIRYVTGDAGVLDAARCRCGRGLPTIRVLGREAERLVSDGAAVPARPQVDRFLSALPDALQGRVRLVHIEPGHLVLQVEDGADGPATLATAAAAAAEAFGPEWRVGARAVDRFSRLPSGKMRYFLPLGAPE